MAEIRYYDIQTDFGRMQFTSDDVLGFWWEQIIQVNGDVSKLF